MKIVRQAGVPLWLLREYLEELGGVANGELEVTGTGWVASLEKAPPYKLGSLVIGRVQWTLEGEEAVLEKLLPRLEMKLLRGGG
jgi:hypothetical protein